MKTRSNARSTFSGLFPATRMLAAILTTFAVIACQKKDSPTGPGSDAKITLSAPVGGETYTVGDTLWVKWSVKTDLADPDPITSVDLLVSPDSGKTWGYARPNSLPIESAFWGIYPWVVTATTNSETGTVLNLASSKCMFQVRDYSTTNVNRMATTKATFTIKAP